MRVNDFSDFDRQANRYAVKIESDIASLRRLYNKLPMGKRIMLEDLLKKLIVCNHLLGELLPTACTGSFMIELDEEFVDRSDNMRVFALSHAYLAVRQWNRGLLYAPKYMLKWRSDTSYPVTLREQTKGTVTQRVHRFVEIINEPLEVKDSLTKIPTDPSEDNHRQASEDDYD